VRGADGDEGADAARQAEVGQRVARVEAAEAVGDEVDALVGQGVDRGDERARARGDRGGGGQADGVGLTAEGLEVARDAAEVIEPGARHADAIESEKSVDEHDRERCAALDRARDPDDAVER
jgi:hypothetical protein